MIRNNDEQHFLSVYCSLNKSIVNAKIYGKLNNFEISILDSIYKLLTKCEDSLTEINKKKLSLLYNHVFYNYLNICKSYDILKANSTFIQNSLINSNNIPVYTYIYYWQEVNYNTTFNDIKTLTADPTYLKSKSYDTFGNFNVGKTINYSNIGRICFVLENTLVSDDYKIYDVLNNNVTEMFDIFYDNINKYYLYVSKNIHSHGDIFFTIKKYN